MSTLLAVDWDYFFPNPLDSGDFTDRSLLLYDWTHAETRYHIELCWAERALGFLHNGLELPRCHGYEGFWDRFDIADTPLLVADSNASAGLLRPTRPGSDTGSSVFDSVWSYDAHHDCGYGITLEQWRRRDTFTCDNWMLVHHELGTAPHKLHVRYPTWKVHAFSVERAPAIDVDRAIDDGSTPAVRFDAMFLARSGAWVPAWNDDQFADFVRSFPGEFYQVDDVTLDRRFDWQVAAQAARQRRANLDRLRDRMRQERSTQ